MLFLPVLSVVSVGCNEPVCFVCERARASRLFLLGKGHPMRKLWISSVAIQGHQGMTWGHRGNRLVAFLKYQVWCNSEEIKMVTLQRFYIQRLATICRWRTGCGKFCAQNVVTHLSLILFFSLESVLLILNLIFFSFSGSKHIEWIIWYAL